MCKTVNLGINILCPCGLNMPCAYTKASLSSITRVCLHCGQLTLFFHQPASLLTSYIHPLPSSSSLLRPNASPLVVELPSERAQCVDWTEGVLYPMAVSLAHRTHTNISAALIISRWAAAVCLAFISDLTASDWCEGRVSISVCKGRSLFSLLWPFLEISNGGETFTGHFDEV